ncbi:MAG: hypothetical protein QM767_03810 [Anaeromyxobacter sp.]
MVSSWASYDMGDLRWDNGTTGDSTGDVTSGYIQAKFARRHLTSRLAGRSWAPARPG